MPCLVVQMMGRMMINIITRATRPHYFEVLEQSIDEQTYDDFQWIIGCDNDKITGDDVIKLTPVHTFAPVPQGLYYAPYNMYLNRLQEEVKDGWCMAIDEDDMFVDKHSLARIASHIGDEDQILVWRVQILPNWIVPSHSFGKQITDSDFSGIGMLWHSKYKPDWGFYSHGDYRAGTQLVEMGCKIKWINQVLTRTQKGPHNGS